MALKDNCSQKEKKSERINMMKRHQNQNANSTGRSYSAPKPVWELLGMESFLIPGWGGGWGSLSKWDCNRAFPVKNKGNESYKEPKEAISTRNISICRNGGRPCSLGLVKHDAWSYQLCALALVRFVSNGEWRKVRKLLNSGFHVPFP